MGAHLLAALALAATAAAPTRPVAPIPPAAPADASAVLVAANPATGLPLLRSFLTEAGAYAASLKPVPLGRSLGGPLRAELFDVQALEQAGVDLAAPLTIAFAGGGTVVCLSSRDSQLRERLEQVVSSAGPAARLQFKGASLRGAAEGQRWREGFASRGTHLCVASGAADVLPILKSAATAMADGGGAIVSRAFKTATAGLKGPLVGFARTGHGTAGFAMSPSAEGLAAEVRVIAGQPLLAPPRAGDPFASLAAVAPLVATATLPSGSLRSPSGPAAETIRFLVNQACRGCDRQVAGTLATELGTKLSGPAALVATRLDPTSARRPLAQYFLVPHAWMLAIKDPEGTRTLLAKTVARMKKAGAVIEEAVVEPGAGPHYTFAVGDRQVFAGFSGQVLYVSNERPALELALKALEGASAGKPETAARLLADGRAISSALRRISLIDVSRSQQLAALFGVGVEYGALLKAIGPITATGMPDPRGARFELSFSLPKAPPMP